MFKTKEKNFFKGNKAYRILLVGFICFMSFLIFERVNYISVMADTALDNEQVGLAGGSFADMVQIVLMQSGAAVTPSFTLTISAIASILSDCGIAEGFFQNYSFGLLDLWWFRIFIFIWAVVSVTPRLFGVTRIGGLVIADLEKKIGQVAVVVINVSQFVNLSGGSVMANAATGIGVAAAGNKDGGTGFGLAIGATVLLIFSAVQYFFVRAFFFYIDIILIPLCTFVPTTSFIVETIKNIIAGLLVLLSFVSPEASLVITLIMLLISVLCYKKACISVRYFKNIYVKPLFKKLRGYDRGISLVDAKLPKSLRRELEERTPELVLPIYLMKKSRLFSFVWKHDRCWLVKEGPACCIYNVEFFTKKVRQCSLPGDRKIFIKKSIRFFEICRFFDERELEKSFLLANKEVHFVLSKEYFYAFEKIKEVTGFCDYDVEKAAYMNSRETVGTEKRKLFSRGKFLKS